MRHQGLYDEMSFKIEFETEPEHLCDAANLEIITPVK